MNTSNINRVEVIDWTKKGGGRVYLKWEDTLHVEIHEQDSGRTLKIIIREAQKCDICNGYGYTTEHDTMENHGPTGECLTCPIQKQCKNCKGIGKII